jgi:hypothetical protein
MVQCSSSILNSVSKKGNAAEAGEMSTTKKNKSGDGWTQKLEENIFSSQPAVD